MSEPNQNSPEGCFRRLIGATASGSTVPSQGARNAIRTMTSRITPPAIAVGCRRKASLKRCQVGEAAMSVADPRIEKRVAEIDRQVDQHIRAGKDQHDALNDRIVATQ